MANLIFAPAPVPNPQARQYVQFFALDPVFIRLIMTFLVVMVSIIRYFQTNCHKLSAFNQTAPGIMITKIFSPDLSNKEQLYQLVVLRQFYLLCEVIVVAMLQWLFVIDLLWHWVWAVVFCHIALTVGYYGFSYPRREIGQYYLVQTVFIDIVLFSVLLYFSGGASNGAVSILLLPVATAAALFNWRLSLSLAVVAIVCYSLLMFYYLPIGAAIDAHHQRSLSPHLVAMWLTFIGSCLLLVWFIGLQSNAVREKNQKLSTLREQQLRDEQLIAIATFSANAAHDLATPLSSISLLCDELKYDNNRAALNTLAEQVTRCREIVQSISHRAILNQSNLNRNRAVDEYFNQLLERWLVTRPEISCQLQQPQSLAAITFYPDAGLESAMSNILDNAADASINNGINTLDLQLEVSKDHQIRVKITDYGTGIDDELIHSLGKMPVQSRVDGLGLGQFLANSTIERNGGHVWRKSSADGTETLISLPLKGL